MNPTMLANLSAMHTRIGSLEARFGTTTPARPLAADTTFASTLARKRLTSSTTPSVTTALAPAPTDDWVRALPDAGKTWAGEIQAAATHHGVDPRLLASLVQQESAFRSDARSHAGAIGLGQLMPGTAAAMGVDPHDPRQNLEGAAIYLREQLDRFGRVDLALAAYNAGPGRVERAGGIPNISETQAYVVNVLDNYDRLVATTPTEA